MSPKRAAAPPPSIPGYRYVSLLGSGGFADVYLYEQDRPRRRVAVKVLLSGLLTEGARRAFESEANLMAQLSSHPYIVTIYEANVTDDGHSYLAMEYCSRPSLDVRYRKARLSVAETLNIGIQVASAVESAHRAGIIHRDIKPANILVTDYGRPALTDFGISGTIDGQDDDDLGMSIPWSPPEAFHGNVSDGVSLDVWSLGATVYTLLAGRSPFVFPGMDNSQPELMTRIATMPLQRIGRNDVPDSLELALATAMSKQPGSRYNSAYSCALTLQRIQTEMGLSVTPFEVLDDTPHLDDDDNDDEFTRVRKVVSIDPDATNSTFDATFPRREAPTRPLTGPSPAPAPGHAVPAHSAGSPEEDTGWREHTVLRGQEPHGDSQRMETTVHRPNADAPESEGAVSEPGSRKRNVVLGVVGSVVLLAGISVGVAAVVSGDPEPEETIAGPTQPPPDALAGVEGNVPEPEDLVGTENGNEVVFTWSNPDPRDGDVYRFRTVTVTDEGEWKRTEQQQAALQANPDGTTCIDVQIARGNGTASEPERACWPE
ncbi:serine/threonine-protein kinase [Arthrobacter sp. H5]|uniref:serine/threonine-protein kinase n=1 Tax=Arthrobacter sp. H5 TaxID=1267973 RepID=UPI0004820C34|nr:serine/threonine-protein kinase [Arthrobacter sp. H5]